MIAELITGLFAGAATTLAYTKNRHQQEVDKLKSQLQHAEKKIEDMKPSPGIGCRWWNNGDVWEDLSKVTHKYTPEELKEKLEDKTVFLQQEEKEGEVALTLSPAAKKAYKLYTKQ